MDLPTPAIIPPRRRSPLSRWLFKIIRGAILIYLGLVLVFYCLKNKIIFAGAVTQGQASARISPGGSIELLTLHASDGTKITAIFGKALGPDGQPLANISNSPSVIFFYGNGECLANSYNAQTIDHFRQIGANVIMPDYEGYGMSGGSATEAGCYATADAVYDYLLTRNDVNPHKFIAAGHSLGSAVAINLASRRPVIGVVAISPFTRMSDVAGHLMPWLPTTLMLWHAFDNERCLARITCPSLLIHGKQDTLVPFWMGDRLAAAAEGKVTHFTVEQGDHNDVMIQGGKAMWEAITDFCQQLN